MKSIIVLYVFSLIILFYKCDYGLSSLVFYYSSIPFYVVVFFSFKREFFVKKNINSIFKIDLFLYFFYFILFYLPYQLDVLGYIDARNNAFIEESFYLYSNKAVILSTIAVMCFFYGFSSKINRAKFRKDNKKYTYFEYFVFILFVIVVLLFLIKGFSNMISGSYSGSELSSNTDNGIYFLVSHFAIMSLAIFVYNLNKIGGLRNIRKLNSVQLISFSVCIVWILLLLVLFSQHPNTTIMSFKSDSSCTNPISQCN